MNLEDLINNDMKSAMLARDKRKLEALRAVKAALLLLKTGKDTSSGEIPPEVEMQMLMKLVKQRKESAQIYQEQSRPDLADEELFQLSIISKYLPEQLSEDELRVIVKEVISSSGATGIKEMGRVMGLVAQKTAGKADNKIVSQIVKELLS